MMATNGWQKITVPGAKMNLEEEIAEKISQELAQTIDDELMIDLLASIGWIKVKRPDGLFGLVDRYTKIKLRTWLDTQCQGRSKQLRDYILFERQVDAVNFLLKWS
jgi:hypothetical protein